MRHRILLGLCLTAVLLLVASGADATTQKFTDLPADAIAIKLLDSVTNVWIPVLAVVAVIGLAVNMFGGFVQVGAKAAGVVIGLSLLAVGLPGLKAIFGGQFVTTLILP